MTCCLLFCFAVISTLKNEIVSNYYGEGGKSNVISRKKGKIPGHEGVSFITITVFTINICMYVYIT